MAVMVPKRDEPRAAEVGELRDDGSATPGDRLAFGVGADAVRGASVRAVAMIAHGGPSRAGSPASSATIAATTWSPCSLWASSCSPRSSGSLPGSRARRRGVGADPFRAVAGPRHNVECTPSSDLVGVPTPRRGDETCTAAVR